MAGLRNIQGILPGVGFNVPIKHHPNIGDSSPTVQQIFGGDVQNPQKGTSIPTPEIYMDWSSFSLWLNSRLDPSLGVFCKPFSDPKSVSTQGREWVKVYCVLPSNLIWVRAPHEGTWMRNVVETIINHPVGNGLYNLFMVIWGMVYYCFNHINTFQVIEISTLSIQFWPQQMALPPSVCEDPRVLKHPAWVPMLVTGEPSWVMRVMNPEVGLSHPYQYWNPPTPLWRAMACLLGCKQPH